MTLIRANDVFMFFWGLTVFQLSGSVLLFITTVVLGLFLAPPNARGWYRYQKPIGHLGTQSSSRSIAISVVFC